MLEQAPHLHLECVPVSGSDTREGALLGKEVVAAREVDRPTLRSQR
jgi:hypothetical protein